MLFFNNKQILDLKVKYNGKSRAPEREEKKP